MSKYRKIQFFYILIDILSAVAVWVLFLLFRWMVNEGRIFSADLLIPAFNLWRFMVLYPIGCLAVYYLSGYYLRPLSHKISQEMLTTLFCSIIISLAAFFIIIIDDPVENYEGYYASLMVLVSLQFLLSWIPRLTLTLILRHVYRNEENNTAIIGEGSEVNKLAAELVDRNIVAVVAPSHLSSFHELKIQKHISEVVVALDSAAGEQKLYQIINRLYPERVQISFPARIYDMLTGAARIGNLSGAPLVTVTSPSMADWQLCFKRAFDVVMSIVALVLMSPLMAVIAICVRASSKGSVIYRQERIGLYGEPFKILKFRTMVADAEADSPMLTMADDPRITPVGRWLRKYRLDELPQFWNILRGDMSIVGPRPERKFYIDKIVEEAPYYCLLYKIRPGLTSWGPIRVGYTDSVEKMVRRLNYDIVYMENMSLRLDLKIMLYTIGVILDGRGQ